MTANRAAAEPRILTKVALQVAATLAFSAYSLHYAWELTSLMPESRPNLAEEIIWTESHSLRGRTLSVVDRLGSGCRIAKEYRLSKDKISSTYLASFHGGGTEVVSNLVQALTGIATTNQVNYAPRRVDHTVLVESHYPRHGALEVEHYDNFRGTILLLRNPITAILSSFNDFYAQKNHFNGDVRAPVDDWIRYRDSAQFAAQVKLYERFVTFWVNKYMNTKREDLLIITYEGLTGGKGEIFTKQIGNFLDKSEGVNVIDPNSITCVWEKFVHDQWYQDGDTSAAATSFQERTDDRPFTQDQLLVVSRMLGTLNQRFGYADKQFSGIMNSYIQSLSGSFLAVG